MDDETIASLFEPYSETAPSGAAARYGGLYPGGSTEMSWQSHNIECALRADRIDMLTECIERGWMDAQTRCFDNSYLVDYADYRGAAKCAAHLRALGWPEHKAA